MSAFLADAELYVLTGYRRAADQIRWLKDKSIPHIVNARGRPVVASDLLNKTPSTEPELGPIP